MAGTSSSAQAHHVSILSRASLTHSGEGPLPVQPTGLCSTPTKFQATTHAASPTPRATVDNTLPAAEILHSYEEGSRRPYSTSAHLPPPPLARVKPYHTDPIPSPR